MATGALLSRERRSVCPSAAACSCTSLTLAKMASVCGTFLGPALGHLAQAEAQGVQLGPDRLPAGELRVGVALALDQLAADLGGGQAAVQPGGLERRVGLAMVLGDGPDVVEQMGQVELRRLAAAAGGGVAAGDAGAGFALHLAGGVAAPAEGALGLALAEGQLGQGAGHVAAAGGAGEGIGRVADERNHFGTQPHRDASLQREAVNVQESKGEAITRVRLSGRSVRPVRWRDSVQAVSPCLARNSLGISDGMAFPPRLRRRGRRRPAAGSFRYTLSLQWLCRVRRPGPRRFGPTSSR